MQVDGVQVNQVPERKEYETIEVDCGEDATGVWDTTEWGLLVKNINKTKVKCTINFVRKEYKEELLHGSDPVLADNLIPVTIEDNGTVTKANTKEEWYNYGNKNWANAVILVDKSITYNASDVIPEENIESYFVWIPKYSYQLFDLGNYTTAPSVTTMENKAKPISVRFGVENTSDTKNGECTTPGYNEEKNTYDGSNVSGASGNCGVGDYMTHPAFISMNTNGLWIGKFESGMKGSNSGSNISDSSQLQIKPDVYSWRNINASNVHLVSTGYHEELDSHMMKNTEWGAVAYLTNSIYGTCIGNNCNEVRINNASDYKTGYAAVHVPTLGYSNTSESCTTYPDNCNEYGSSTTNLNEPWNTSIGVLASTTSNISGIYDMSGGVLEYMMGMFTDSNGTPISGTNSRYNSGFSGTSGVGDTISGIDFPSSKYYDLYKYSTSATIYNKRILGDATGEMGPFGTVIYKGNSTEATNKELTVGSWGLDWGKMLIPNYPWLARGERYMAGVSAGVFAFGSVNGSGAQFGFRVVLATK